MVEGSPLQAGDGGQGAQSKVIFVKILRYGEPSLTGLKIARTACEQAVYGIKASKMFVDSVGSNFVIAWGGWNHFCYVI